LWYLNISTHLLYNHIVGQQVLLDPVTNQRKIPKTSPDIRKIERYFIDDGEYLSGFELGLSILLMATTIGAPAFCIIPMDSTVVSRMPACVLSMKKESECASVLRRM
jgi:hypothetical protein